MRRIILVFMLAALVVMAVAGTAWAQPPVVATEVDRFTEGPFSDEPARCQTEPYTSTFYVHSVEHFTYFEETGALHYHLLFRGKVVAVPLDGTGPSYTGNFRVSDSENIRSVKHGEVLVETDTDHDRAVLKGSDGSKAFYKFHAHFTVNANGVEAVRFETERLICT